MIVGSLQLLSESRNLVPWIILAFALMKSKFEIGLMLPSPSIRPRVLSAGVIHISLCVHIHVLLCFWNSEGFRVSSYRSCLSVFLHFLIFRACSSAMLFCESRRARVYARVTAPQALFRFFALFFSLVLVTIFICASAIVDSSAFASTFLCVCVSLRLPCLCFNNQVVLCFWHPRSTKVGWICPPFMGFASRMCTLTSRAVHF